MQFIDLITSLFFLSGFYFLGNIIFNFFKLKVVISNISDGFYQNFTIGLVTFIFILYPIFF